MCKQDQFGCLVENCNYTDKQPELLLLSTFVAKYECREIRRKCKCILIKRIFENLLFLKYIQGKHPDIWRAEPLNRFLVARKISRYLYLSIILTVSINRTYLSSLLLTLDASFCCKLLILIYCLYSDCCTCKAVQNLNCTCSILN